MKMDVVALAFGMAEAVGKFVARARRFWYTVMLLGYKCPACGGGLDMVAESRSQCWRCGWELDPTVEFQRCSVCGGKLRLRVRRYECRQCGAEARSRFAFEGRAFDAEYFRQRMVEHRQRKAEQRERVREMLAESHSADVCPGPIDLNGIAGLREALDGLAGALGEYLPYHPPEGFDLKRYQSHLQAHIGQIPASFDAIPALEKGGRKDRVWRFIAVVFLAHMGLIELWQDGPTIMVMQRETDREGQEVPGDAEAAHGIQGSLGRAPA